MSSRVFYSALLAFSHKAQASSQHTRLTLFFQAHILVLDPSVLGSGHPFSSALLVHTMGTRKSSPSNKPLGTLGLPSCEVAWPLPQGLCSCQLWRPCVGAAKRGVRTACLCWGLPEAWLIEQSTPGQVRGPEPIQLDRFGAFQAGVPCSGPLQGTGQVLTARLRVRWSGWHGRGRDTQHGHWVTGPFRVNPE